MKPSEDYKLITRLLSQRKISFRHTTKVEGDKRKDDLTIEDGYIGFVTVISFVNGELIRIAAYE